MHDWFSEQQASGRNGIDMDWIEVAAESSEALLVLHAVLPGFSVFGHDLASIERSRSG
jgi:hypothetical protein